MKTITTILAFLLFFSPALCQELPDTLLNIPNPSRLVITENKEGTTFNVISADSIDFFEESVTTEYPYDSSVSAHQTTYTNIFGEGILYSYRNRNRCSSWDIIVDGLCIGLNNASGQPAPDALQWSKSFEISWMSCIGISYTYKTSSISFGFGFDWRNYRCTTSDRRLVVNESKGIGWGNYSEGEKGRLSRLKTFSLQFPLLYKINIPKTSLSIKAGPVMCVNTYGSIKTVYDDANGNKCEEFLKDIRIRDFTVDLFGCISYNLAIGIYVRYSTMKVMDASGLNFRPLTIGLSLGI